MSKSVQISAPFYDSSLYCGIAVAVMLGMAQVFAHPHPPPSYSTPAARAQAVCHSGPLPKPPDEIPGVCQIPAWALKVPLQPRHILRLRTAQFMH